jgi:hypothetical protein
MVQATPLPEGVSGAPVSPNPPAEAFGGNAIGAGLADVAKGIQTYSDVQTQRAEQLATLNNRASADANNFHFTTDMTSAINDWQTKHVGQASLDPSAQADLDTTIEGLRQKYRQGLGNPMAQSFFDQDSRRMAMFQVSDARRYLAQQQHSFRTDQNKQVIETNVALGANDPLNAGKATVALGQIDGSLVDLGAQFGWSKEIMDGERLKAHGMLWAKGAENLARSDPELAAHYLDAHKEDMDADQYHAAWSGLSGPLAAHGAVISARAGQAVAGSGGEGLKAAILGQESGNSDTVRNSVQGAVGPGQVMPETFKQWAQPGEDIHNPADNRAVSGRMLDAYMQKYGDARRAAVAYFSGTGNVAPSGSPTPWINDRADKNGTTTSQYVSQVMGRMGNTEEQYRQGFGPGEQTAMDAAAAYAKKYNLDPATVQQAAIGKYRSDYGIQREQYALSTANDRSTMADAVSTAGPDGQPATSLDQLMAVPGFNEAWARNPGDHRKVLAQLNSDKRSFTDPGREADLAAMAAAPDKTAFFAQDVVHDPLLTAASQAAWGKRQAKLRASPAGSVPYSGAETAILRNSQLPQALQSMGYSDPSTPGHVRPDQQANANIFIGKAIAILEDRVAANPQWKGHVPPEEVWGAVQKAAVMQHTTGMFSSNVNYSSLSPIQVDAYRPRFFQQYGYQPTNRELGWWVQHQANRGLISYAGSHGSMRAGMDELKTSLDQTADDPVGAFTTSGEDQ